MAAGLLQAQHLTRPILIPRRHPDLIIGGGAVARASNIQLPWVNSGVAESGGPNCQFCFASRAAEQNHLLRPRLRCRPQEEPDQRRADDNQHKESKRNQGPPRTLSSYLCPPPTRAP